MKKSIIKRRKRVIPATQGTSPGDDYASSAGGGNSPTPEASPEPMPERGTLNADGSVNLGFRRRQEQGLTLVPEPVLRQSKQSSPRPTGTLEQYHNNPYPHPHDISDSLTNDNRLPPLTSLGFGTERQSSLSPASFLSPSRKRSFSSADHELPPPQGGDDHSQRLSSIKSILNSVPPSTGAPGRHMRGSPATRHDFFPGRGGSPLPPLVGGPSASGRDSSSHESERIKAEKRSVLQREAERMREMLAAKERELAELGRD